MNKKDLLAKDNLSLLKENENLKVENAEMKKKLEYYARVVDLSEKQVLEAEKRADKQSQEAIRIMRKYDELKSFLWRAKNESGKMQVWYDGRFGIETIPKLPEYAGAGDPPRLMTVSRIYID